MLSGGEKNLWAEKSVTNEEQKDKNRSVHKGNFKISKKSLNRAGEQMCSEQVTNS